MMHTIFINGSRLRGDVVFAAVPCRSAPGAR